MRAYGTAQLLVTDVELSHAGANVFVSFILVFFRVVFRVHSWHTEIRVIQIKRAVELSRSF